MVFSVEMNAKFYIIMWIQNSIGEESHLAIETSGHGALKENHWLDDGAYLMVRNVCSVTVEIHENIGF
jgi:hypothetical protein